MKSRLDRIKENIKVINVLNDIQSVYELTMAKVYLEDVYFNMIKSSVRCYVRDRSFEKMVLRFKDQHKGKTPIQELCDKYLLRIK